MVRGVIFSCVGVLGEDVSLLFDTCWYESYGVFYSAYNVSTVVSSWEISVSWLIGVDVEGEELDIGYL